ncbi:molybdopterin oxidoreductase [Aureimonas sp. Leaf454]|uniref:molybdopterin-dependent oxidoreductase n=1 Tax=Aureimonas sp. Leaf454 TaxID=1736381 RepID=UPI0006FD979A|nr:molybdopterin-dependent oxidoreductase [Aureimonas sp. Leaf454]KQT48673.1 molybdopterin oxidoreductase [Aureimonas sp. Leaf454]
MDAFKISRRRFLTGSAVTAAGLSLTGCFDAAGDPKGSVRGVLETANSLTYRVQRLLLSSDSLAKEFSESEIRQDARANGTVDPQDADYRRLAANGFADWRLAVTGLVEQPLSLSLAELRAMPSRTQITRHDCVEGWSCIAKWTGVPLAFVLDQARVRSNARFAVFTCMDSYGGGFTAPVKYYESIDLVDARHAQTILAHGCNGETLAVANGAPLRVRVERQLGYKMAKYIAGIELTDSLDRFGGGKGGYWEDNGYDWFAGI